MLVVPNLSETPFHRIEASFAVPLDDFSKSEYESYVPFEKALTAKIEGERPVFATLEMGADGGGIGDLEASLSVSFQNPPRTPYRADLAAELLEDYPFSLDKWEQSDSESIWKSLSAFLEKRVNLFVKASFTVNRDQLPTDSLVDSMIGLRTKAGEEQFLLSGAQLAVRGFPDDTISWYLMPGSNGQQVAGDITRHWMEKFRPESISDAIHVLEARFNRVVRVHSSIAHATS